MTDREVLLEKREKIMGRDEIKIKRDKEAKELRGGRLLGSERTENLNKTIEI